MPGILSPASLQWVLALCSRELLTQGSPIWQLAKVTDWLMEGYKSLDNS